MPGGGSSRQWTVWLTAAAQADLDRLDPPVRFPVTERLRRLAEEPLPRGGQVEKLHGTRRSVWRLRMGNFRILYQVGNGRVTVERVVNRRDLDRAVEALR